MTDLKPCPFCGGEAELETRKGCSGMTQYRYRCSECHAAKGRWHGGISGHPWTAAEAWNARAERTCECDSTLYWETGIGESYYEHELSCGHTIKAFDKELPNYCPNCGAKVVDA